MGGGATVPPPDHLVTVIRKEGNLARPQIENGHTDIANELTEAFARCYLTASESRVLWAIIRKTYGWHKKYDRISFTQFEQLTGMNRRHVADALKSLMGRSIVTRRGNNYKLEYGVQKDYEKWVLLPVGVMNRLKNLLPVEATNTIVTQQGNTPLPVEATKSLPVEANTKEKKTTIQKKIVEGRKIAGYMFELPWLNKLVAEYADLNFEAEVTKFEDYQADTRRKLKSPKLALRNWLNIARERAAKAPAASRGARPLPDTKTLKEEWEQ
uniref:Putative DNA replication initiation protein n=1 Tax=viral metagenome TaxID=1070528 RepID=A0A6M3J8E7_9ZZZZ